MNFFIDLDHRLFNFLHDLAGKSFVHDWIFFTIAESTVYLIAIVVIIYLWRDLYITKKIKIPQWEIFASYTLPLACAFLTAELFHLLFHRTRPFVLFDFLPLFNHHPLQSAFPSLHTTIMCALAFTLLQKHRTAGFIVSIFAVMSGITRVIIGVHFPSDVASGIVISILSVLVTHRLAQRYFPSRAHALT